MVQKNLNKQEKKSVETKKKLFTATVELLKSQDYDSLTIRNICQTAGVSIGSFYHQFHNKDDLLSYYLSAGFDDFLLQHPLMLDDDLTHIVCQVYGRYADYCVYMGLEFISHYYSIQNRALATYTEKHQLDQAQNFIFTTIFPALKKAQDTKKLNAVVNIDDVYNELCMVVKGCIFEWASSQAGFELRVRIEKLLIYYLNNIVIN